MEWLLLITNLPGRNPTLRMRLWRGLKATGAALLRDGVYLLPGTRRERAAFETRAGEIVAAGGTAYVLPCTAGSPLQESQFLQMFSRAAGYGELIRKLGTFRRRLPRLTEPVAQRDIERLQRELAQLVATDFFPDSAREQAQSVMTDAREALSTRFSPGEPRSRAHRRIDRRDRGAFTARTWVTRERLWIDRVCSAWLIRRFIDPKARFLWLADPGRRPKRSVGFDFDGAEFTHIGEKVTFEVLMESFGLQEDAALGQIAALVHYLDVGGVPVAEAAGFAAMMSGLRALGQGDDALLASMSPVLGSLYAAFANDAATGS